MTNNTAKFLTSAEIALLRIGLDAYADLCQERMNGCLQRSNSEIADYWAQQIAEAKKLEATLLDCASMRCELSKEFCQ